MRTTEEYAAMIPTAPPFDLVGYLREKGKMQTEVISYKWLGRDDADSWMDCEDCQEDLRPSAATRSALLWCSACGGRFLAEYLPRENAAACHAGSCTGYSGVQIADAEVMEIIRYREYDKLCCPLCGAEAVLYSTNSLRYGLGNQEFVVVPTVAESCLVLTQWCIERRIYDGRAAMCETAVNAYIAVGGKIKELQAKNAGYAEQLSLLQDQKPVADAQAEEVDMDALREEIRAEVKAEMDSLHQADAKMAELNQKERDEAVKAAKDAREKLEAAQQAAEDAQKAHAEELEKVRAQAEATAIAMEKSYKDKLAESERKAWEEAAEARRQAEETARRMDMAADESAVRFGLLFDQLQDAAGKVLDLADTVQAAGDTEKAGKFRAALRRALLALADEAEGVQD